MWVGDGFCDDVNNVEDCNYDGGDCCGISVQNNFCVNCTCTGRCELTYYILDIVFFVYYFNQQINWIVTLMLPVMVMDFVVKVDVCAHLNIITKRTALYMDVS